MGAEICSTFGGTVEEIMENIISGKIPIEKAKTCLSDPEVLTVLDKPVAKLGDDLFIHKAALEGNLEVVKEVLAKKPGQLKVEKELTKADVLQFAVKSGNLDLVKFVIAQGADPNKRYFFETHIMYFAVKYNHLHLFKYFVEELKMDPAELLAANAIQPIYMSIEQENKEMFDYIISKNTVLENLGCWNLLGIASRIDDTHYLETLIAKGAPFEKTQPYDRSPFAWSVEDNFEKQAIILMKTVKGLKPEVCNCPGTTLSSKFLVGLMDKWWRLYDVYSLRYFSTLKRKEIDVKSPDIDKFLADPTMNKIYNEYIDKPGKIEALPFKLPYNIYHKIQLYLEVRDITE